MKKLFTLFSFIGLLSVHAQTVVYTENFEGASTFNLNTADVSSTTSGSNTWIINNTYAGGNFNESCFGFPVTVPTTASQPIQITNAPASNYMHILSIDAFNGGINNCNFIASDGGSFCVLDEGYFSGMANDISTTGLTGVTLSFWWLCAGSSTMSGEVYYSLNSGSSWNLIQGGMDGQNTWTQATFTNGFFDNQATLRFGFRFSNNFAASASDPGFAVDQISVYVPAAATCTTGTTAPLYCPGASFNLNYTITGTYNGGNVFTAQLSDAAGSFAAPTNIGSVASTSAGSISCTIPLATPVGAGYKIRVVSSNPVVTGTETAAFAVNCAGIEEEELNAVSLYPNPSSDVFTISIHENMVGNTTMKIMNLVGSTVYTAPVSQAKTNLSAESLKLNAGIYLIELNYKNESRVIRLVIR